MEESSSGWLRYLKTQYLATSQVVVCKILWLPFLIPKTLLLTIPFHLTRVALAILLPVIRVCLAPLPRTVQTNLSINRIGSNLSPMIITLALALTCGMVADRLLRMISRGLKDLLTVTATEIFHQAFPSILEVCLGKRPVDLTALSEYSMGLRADKRHRIMPSTSSTRLLGLFGWVGDQLSLGSRDLRKNMQRISPKTHCGKAGARLMLGSMLDCEFAGRSFIMHHRVDGCCRLLPSPESFAVGSI